MNTINIQVLRYTTVAKKTFFQTMLTSWFQASVTKQMTTVLFWAIMQQVVVISYWRFGTIYQFHLQMLIRNYYHLPH